jgi:hypothetical protein
VPFASNEDPVGALASCRADPRSAKAFALGACGGVRSTSIPAAVKSAGQDLTARIPGVQYVVFPGVGHDWPEGIWDDVIARMSRVAAVT